MPVGGRGRGSSSTDSLWRRNLRWAHRREKPASSDHTWPGPAPRAPYLARPPSDEPRPTPYQLQPHFEPGEQEGGSHCQDRAGSQRGVISEEQNPVTGSEPCSTRPSVYTVPLGTEPRQAAVLLLTMACRRNTRRRRREAIGLCSPPASTGLPPPLTVVYQPTGSGTFLARTARPAVSQWGCCRPSIQPFPPRCSGSQQHSAAGYNRVGAGKRPTSTVRTYCCGSQTPPAHKKTGSDAGWPTDRHGAHASSRPTENCAAACRRGSKPEAEVESLEAGV